MNELMCNPQTGEEKDVAVGCNCGIDAEVLKKAGWVNCIELYPREV
ncbi:hypothetical protein J4233_03845 [Candidatus Pacearchaeota archaeon]|nr:hypothetical protein [Candidatus Pacearchaeota archaeon]